MTDQADIDQIEWDRSQMASESLSTELDARTKNVWADNDNLAYYVGQDADIIESIIEGEISRQYQTAFIEGGVIDFDLQAIIEAYPEVIAGIIRHYPEIKERLNNSIVNAIENDLGI
jgi:hypothetical protein